MSASPVQPHEVAAAPSADERSASLPAAGASQRPAAMWRSWPAFVVGCIALVGIGWLTLAPRSVDDRPVQNGRRFSGTERREAEQALRSAGIANVRVTRDQVFVAAESLAAADAALDQAVANSVRTAAASPTAGSLLDQFSTGRRHQQASESARAAQVGRLLEQLPGVAAAEVVWDEEPRIGRRQPPRVRATVFLKPEPETVLGLDTVHAVRTAVAGSRAHLAAADVAVMDLNRQLTYDVAGDPAAIDAEARLAQAIRFSRRRLEAALADIAGVRIIVAACETAVGEADHAAAHGIEPTVRQRPFAGPAGPNLRMEVAAIPQPSAPTLVSLPASSGATLPSSEKAAALDVTIVVPPQYVVSRVTASAEAGRMRRSGRDAAAYAEQRQAWLQAEIRQRVQASLADGPTHGIPARVEVQLEQSSERPLPATAAAVADKGWFNVTSAAVPAALRRPAIIVVAVTAAVLAIGAMVRSRRRGTRSIRLPGTSPQNAMIQGHPAARSATGFLPGVDVEVWAPLAAREPLEKVAGLLPRLLPNEVAHLMAQLAPSDQRDVLQLVLQSTLDDRAVEGLRRRLLSGLQATSPPTATATSTTVTRPVVRTAARGPNSSLPSVAGFDDLARVDEASLQSLAARVPAETWSAALVGASPKLVRRLGKLTRGAGQAPPLAERKPVRLHEIESAQRLIVEEWLSLQ